MTQEKELREWLADNVSRAVTIQWVEPGRYGSTMGAADAIVKRNDVNVSLELKIWSETRSGIRCKMRPIQRRWHHQTMRKGGRCAVLFCIMDTDDIFLVRGDRVPLRDYAAHPDSGCPNGKLHFTRVYNDIEALLFNDMSYEFWM